MSNFKLSVKSKRNREGIDPRLIEISDLAITLTKVDFGHPMDSGLRTPERQNELFRASLSKCDGYKFKSGHQSGKCLDFYAYVDGKASWGRNNLTSVAVAFFQAAAFLGYHIEWGGLWTTFEDYPHIQLIDKGQ